MSRALRVSVEGPAKAKVFADLHALAFPSECWSARAIGDLLATPGTTGLLAARTAPEGLALIRTVLDEAEILTLGVVPAARRRGVGVRLLDAAVIAAAESGAVSLFLEVAIDNEPARQLYLGRGFLEVGRRLGYYERGGGPRQDALILRLAIGGALGHDG